MHPSFDDDLVPNKKSKKVTVKKVNGRLAVFNGEKRVGGSRLLYDRLEEMESEVNHATKGHAITTMKDHGAQGVKFKRYGVQSTFPGWFKEAGFNSKKDFRKALAKKAGVRYKRLVNEAQEDLQEGYRTQDGEVPASRKWKVKTRQKFDNKNVIFRRINGRIVPIRVKKKRLPKLEEVPF